MDLFISGSRCMAYSVILFCVVMVMVGSNIEASEEKTVVGWVEKVRIYPGGLVLHAKTDTGADNSSLNVSEYTEFRRGNENWIRFEVTNRDGDTAVIERRVVRMAKIKRHEGKRQQRPVVILGVCLGKIYREVEVNLVDRSRFKYRMLLGRSFMGDLMLVDPARKYTVEPACREVADL